MSSAPEPKSQTPAEPSRLESVSSQTSTGVGALLFIRSLASWTPSPFESRYIYCAAAGRARSASTPTATPMISRRYPVLWVIRRIAVMIQMCCNHVEIHRGYRTATVEVEPIADQARNSDTARDGTKVRCRHSLALVDVDPQPLHRVKVLDAQRVSAVCGCRGQPAGQLEAQHHDGKVRIVMAPLSTWITRPDSGAPRSRPGERDVGDAIGIGGCVGRDAPHIGAKRVRVIRGVRDDGIGSDALESLVGCPAIEQDANVRRRY